MVVRYGCGAIGHFVLMVIFVVSGGHGGVVVGSGCNRDYDQLFGCSVAKYWWWIGIGSGVFGIYDQLVGL